MIQRIQTIFLAAAALCAGAVFLLPFASTATARTEGIFSDALFNISDSAAVSVMSGVSLLLFVIAIFMYKNRPQQVVLTFVTILATLSVPVLATILLRGSGVASFAYRAGMFTPFAAAVLAIIAIYFIRKDEKLVRSMDRLR